jgi:hypothetical protein
MRYSRRNGDQEICRPLRGLGNSCACSRGSRPGLYAVARSARTLTFSMSCDGIVIWDQDVLAFLRDWVN